MKRSIGFRAHDSSLTLGKAGRVGALKAQWSGRSSAMPIEETIASSPKARASVRVETGRGIAASFFNGSSREGRGRS
jgi:hypothetical protein